MAKAVTTTKTATKGKSLPAAATAKSAPGKVSAGKLPASKTSTAKASPKTPVQAARIGRNPATNEAIQIEASRKVAFRAAKELKNAI